MSLFQPTRFLSPKEISRLFFLFMTNNNYTANILLKTTLKALSMELIILFDLICARKNIDTFFS